MIVSLFKNVRHYMLLGHRSYAKYQHPFSKAIEVISNEIPDIFGLNKKPIIYPQHADIVVIGGGFIGSSVAYWLKTRASEGLSVVVLEKDLSYKHAQTNLSFGSLVQHFSLPENVFLAQYGADFLRNIKENLNDNVDIQYCPRGHLVLASEKYADKLEQNVTLQKEYGVKNELLTVEEIKNRYPWINTNDIHLGCVGSESEGTFNSLSFLRGLVLKAQELGSIYVNAEVTGFELEMQRDALMEGIAPGSYKKINRVLFKAPDGEEYAIKFSACILAAGDASGDIAKLAGIGTGDGMLTIPLPIERRDCQIYSVEDGAKKTGLNTPLISDTSGLWLGRNDLDSNLQFGHAPLLTDDVKDLPEEEYYRKVIEPSFVNRLPSCKDLKVAKLINEKFDSNSYDDTGILGPHPYHNNLYIAAGFGKLGCQHTPGIGRAIAELIIDSHYITIDLTRFTFDRLLTDQPLVDFNIY